MAKRKKPKNLYLLTQDEYTGWDTYDSCIVCAESEEAAIRIHPSVYDSFDDDGLRTADCCDSGNWATTIKNVKCKLIAENAMCDYGVVLSSFNAG